MNRVTIPIALLRGLIPPPYNLPMNLQALCITGDVRPKFSEVRGCDAPAGHKSWYLHMIQQDLQVSDVEFGLSELRVQDLGVRISGLGLRVEESFRVSGFRAAFRLSLILGV